MFNKILRITDIGYYILIFFFLIIFLLMEGLICEYAKFFEFSISFKNFLNGNGFNYLSYFNEVIVNGKNYEDIGLIDTKFCKNDFFIYFWRENGFVENFQTFFLIVAIIFLYKAKKKYQSIKIIRFFLILKILALIYYVGEEISWGQHLFSWESSNFFKKLNNQDETNLHNISNLFNEIPRTLVFIWCSFIPFITLLTNRYFKFNRSILLILYPEKKLINLSLMLIVFSLPYLLVDKFNLHPGYIDQNGIPIYDALFYDLLTFNFLRLSELQELIFTFYFAIYSFSFFYSRTIISKS